MFKMKKLAAVAAAAVMAVSTMAVSVSAESINTDPPAYSPYGYFRGILTIAPAPFSGARKVTADTVLLGSSNAPEVVADLTIRPQGSPIVWFHDANTTHNSAYAAVSATANSSSANDQPITATGLYRVGNGVGQYWDTQLIL